MILRLLCIKIDKAGLKPGDVRNMVPPMPLGAPRKMSDKSSAWFPLDARLGLP